MPRALTGRLAAGIGLLALIALTTVLSATSAFAQVSTVSNVIPAALTCATGTGTTPTGTATATACGITPGGNYTLTTTHVYATPFTPGAGGVTNVASSTPIRRMWQLHQSTIAYPRWGHAAGTHWFYLWADNVNSAASTTGIPHWAFYYYAPPARTSTLIASTGVSGTALESNGAVATAGCGAAGTAPGGVLCVGTIFAQSSSRAPIANILGVMATSTGGTNAGTGVSYPGVFGSATLMSNLQWGHAQEWWAAGTVAFHQNAQTWPLGTPPATSTTGWQNSGVTLTLQNSAPTQTFSGGGNRVTMAGQTTPFIIAAADANGDIQRVRLHLKRTGTAGDFSVGVVAAENSGDNVLIGCGTSGPATLEYRSNAESTLSFPCGTSLVSQYLGSTSGGTTSSVTASNTTTTANLTSNTYTFNLVFSTSARGTWTVYSAVSDQHGGSTGLVQQGTITVQ